MIDTTKYTQLLIFKRHWTLAVAVGLGVLAIIVPVALGLPPVYRATANLRVERQVGTGSLASVVGGMDLRMQTIKQDLLSRAQVIKLINDLNLYPAWRESQPLDVIIERVRKDIVIQPQMMPVANGPQAILSFTVSYTGEDPQSAERAANALASFYVDQNGLLRTRSVDGALTALKSQADDANRRVNDAAAKVQDYIAKNPNSLPEAVNRIAGELQRTTTLISTKTGQESTYKTRINELNTLIVTENNRPITTATTQTPEQQLAALIKERDALLAAGKTELWPDVRTKNQQIQALRESLPAPTRSAAASPATDTPVANYERQRAQLQKDLDEVRSELAQLEQTQAKLSAQLLSAPTRNPQLEMLQSDLTLQREGYALIKKQYDQAASAEKTTRDLDAEEFRIEDPARAPDKAYGPNRINLIILGLFLAVVAGIGAAILRDQLDTSFHTLDELRTFTQVPVLVSIPDIKTRQQRVRQSLVMTTAAIVILCVLGAVGVGAYHYAQNHSGITRIVSR
jgi:polysaccharide biosynthesis transport protein